MRRAREHRITYLMSAKQIVDLWERRANTTHWTNAVLMLGQHRRRWANNKPALGRRLVLTDSVILHPVHPGEDDGDLVVNKNSLCKADNNLCEKRISRKSSVKARAGALVQWLKLYIYVFNRIPPSFFNLGFRAYSYLWIAVTAKWIRTSQSHKITKYNPCIWNEAQELILIMWSSNLLTSFIWVRYGKIQHSSNEWGVSLQANTLFIGRVLYFRIWHKKWATFVFSHTIKSHMT